VRRRQAYLVLIDESGLLLAPLRRRTLAVRGHTPILQQRARQRDKVSVAGALWLSPRRDRLGLLAMTLLNDYFDSAAAAAFLAFVAESLSGSVVVVWDQGPMHKGEPIREVLHQHRQLHLEALPPYAPELNPVEWLWKWLKYDQLCNFAPSDAQQLEAEASARLRSIQGDQAQLRQFIHNSDLPLQRTLLF
jgi:transposase